jgi:hypothetical protein
MKVTSVEVAAGDSPHPKGASFAATHSTRATVTASTAGTAAALHLLRHLRPRPDLSISFAEYLAIDMPAPSTRE